jgi:hypothetical protein
VPGDLASHVRALTRRAVAERLGELADGGWVLGGMLVVVGCVVVAWSLVGGWKEARR